MNNKIILCIGQCVLDLIHLCESYPIEDTDKRCVNGHLQRGGNASNMVTVLSNLGKTKPILDFLKLYIEKFSILNLQSVHGNRCAKCEFLGILSNKKGYGMLIEDFITRNIIIANCPRLNIDVPFSSVILTQNTKSRTIIHYNPNYPILKYEHFKDVDLNNYNWIHFEGRNIEDTIKIQEHITKYNKDNMKNIKISLELEKSNLELLKLTNLSNVIFISKDFAKFMKWSNSKETVLALREKLLNKNCTIICPWGDETISIITEDNCFEQVEPLKPDIIMDTLGAGDTFIAATIFSLSENNPIKNAVKFACNVTNLKLQNFGYDNIKNFK